MYKIGYIGNFKTVPQVVEHIINNDIDNLEKEYNNGWDINQKIVLSEYADITPIKIAIQCKNERAIKWLLEKGANVRAKEGDWVTPISDAARFCTTEICELFIQHGALENLTKRQCKRIYDDIFFGKNFKNIDVFEKHGITVKKYGSNCLRSAIYEKDKKLAQMFLDYGADINYHEYEMVFTQQETPVMVATQRNSIDLVKWLVEKGADITIKSKYGERPYTIAVLNNNQEMIEYIKSLEPEDFHNAEALKEIIKKYNLINTGDKIVLGVSGGPDSIAMLDILRQLKSEMEFEIYVVHINHSIRGEDADEDEEYVKNYCRKYEIECFTKKIDVPTIARTEKIGTEEEGD